MKKVRIFIFVVIVFLLSRTAHAYSQVLIDEIMYDVSGTDSGREWVEVYNSGDAAVDLTQWKLFIGDKNHVIKQSDDNGALDAGAYAIIADNAGKFSADYPDYDGLIYTSSFSLSNKGATIGLKDASSNVIHQITYGTDVGASGDGDSLQKIDGAWHAASPTPGEANALSDARSSAPVVSASIDVTGDLFAGETLTFDPQFADDTSIDKVTWNFGDGTTLNEDGTDAVEHMFSFGGTYTVVLADASGTTIAETAVTMADKPSLAETIKGNGDMATVVSTKDLKDQKEQTASTEIPLAAAAADSGIHASDWLVGFAAVVAIAVFAIRTFKKPKSEVVIPDDVIELID